MSNKKRKVQYFHNISQFNGTGGYTGTKKEMGGQAIFHGFGVNYEEFDSGPGNYSTAIIELDDGTVLNHPVELIKFVTNED